MIQYNSVLQYQFSTDTDTILLDDQYILSTFPYSDKSG